MPSVSRCCPIKHRSSSYPILLSSHKSCEAAACSLPSPQLFCTCLDDVCLRRRRQPRPAPEKRRRSGGATASWSRVPDSIIVLCFAGAGQIARRSAEPPTHHEHRTAVSTATTLATLHDRRGREVFRLAHKSPPARLREQIFIGSPLNPLTQRVP